MQLWRFCKGFGFEKNGRWVRIISSMVIVTRWAPEDVVFEEVIVEK
jgi:hypothetical protein